MLGTLVREYGLKLEGPVDRCYAGNSTPGIVPVVNECLDTSAELGGDSQKDLILDLAGLLEAMKHL